MAVFLLILLYFSFNIGSYCVVDMQVSNEGDLVVLGMLKCSGCMITQSSCVQ